MFAVPKMPPGGFALVLDEGFGFAPKIFGVVEVALLALPNKLLPVLVVPKMLPGGFALGSEEVFEFAPKIFGVVEVVLPNKLLPVFVVPKMLPGGFALLLEVPDPKIFVPLFPGKAMAWALVRVSK